MRYLCIMHFVWSQTQAFNCWYMHGKTDLAKTNVMIFLSYAHFFQIIFFGLSTSFIITIVKLFLNIENTFKSYVWYVAMGNTIYSTQFSWIFNHFWNYYWNCKSNLISYLALHLEKPRQWFFLANMSAQHERVNQFISNYPQNDSLKPVSSK